MIYSYEKDTLSEHFPQGNWGVRSYADDQEEWLGIRSQLIAALYGWAWGLVDD